jgi:hypothetical protein
MSGFEDNGGLDDGGAWEQVADSLAAYLATMRAEDDHLIVEAPDGDDEEGATPYAQFCVGGPGWIRAEISGNAVLSEPFRLTDDQIDLMVEGMGWEAPADGDESPNFHLHHQVEDADDAEGIAIRVREVFEDLFGIPHPTLMSARAWGPAAAGVSSLGIPASADVATDIVDTDEVPPADSGVTVPRDRDHLLELVRRFLTDYLGEEPIQDDDSDFVIPRDGAPVYVRVRAEQPIVDVFTWVVHSVRSRRQAAVEVGLLNRDHLLAKFVLNDRAIYQLINVPAMPFVPAHLRLMLPGYLALVDEVRSDLALRTSGRIA